MVTRRIEVMPAAVLRCPGGAEDGTSVVDPMNLLDHFTVSARHI
jgi:hypothetical protein